MGNTSFELDRVWLSEIEAERYTNSKINRMWLSEKEAQVYTQLGRDRLLAARKDALLTYRMIGSKIIYHIKDLDNFIIRNAQLFKSVDDLRRKK